jgi:putative restriction endonuclease
MTHKPWTRDEVLIAFNLYCQTPFGRLHARNPEIVRVAALMNRTPGALAMKCCNLAALDPSLQQRGLSKVSSLDRKLWEEFQGNQERIAFQSEMAVANLTGSKPRMADSLEWESRQGIEKTVATKVRVNQHFFRSMVLAGYREACAVCSIPIPSLLVASHIVPWALDPANRMNPRNGLCLCCLHDRAFDKGVLHIGQDYVVRITAKVQKWRTIEVVQQALLRHEGQNLHLPDRWLPDKALLSRHAEQLGLS